MTDKWIKRWKVLSESNPDKEYTVAIDAEGNYGCSCPVWKFRRRECKHIQAVKDGGYEPVDAPPHKEPTIILASVRAVTAVPSDSGEVTEVHVPLMPLEDTHFQATLVHDLLCLGVSWRTCKERYHIAKANSKKAIIGYVETHGRRIYGPWQEKRGYVGFSTVPCEHPFTL